MLALLSKLLAAYGLLFALACVVTLAVLCFWAHQERTLRDVRLRALRDALTRERRETRISRKLHP